MAKITGPLLSLGARGQIGKSQVYAQWRGVPYARQLTTPRNPNSAEQQKTRGVFGALMQLWKLLDTDAVAPWAAWIKGKPMTTRNAFAHANVGAMRGQTDRTDFTASPGAAGGIPSTSVSATAGSNSGDIDVTVVAPDAPPDWTLTSIVAFAMQDGDPATDVPQPVATGKLTSPTAGSSNSVTISGLKAATLHVVTGWLVWTKPNGSLAYSPSRTTTGTSAT